MNNTIPRDVRFEYYKSPQFRRCEPGSVSLNQIRENKAALKPVLEYRNCVKVSDDLSCTPGGDHPLHNIYRNDLTKLIESMPDRGELKFPFYYMQGDTRGQVEFHYPMLAKARQHLYGKNPDFVSTENDPLTPGDVFPHQATILKCFNQNRHWVGHAAQTAKMDLDYYRTLTMLNSINFKDKIDRVAWRGITTCAYLPVEISQRTALVKRYFHDPDMDIAFSGVLPGHRERMPELQQYIRQPIRDYTQHKYLISVHGNDKDSGLNWKLQTDSVVLMPEPYIESWLMEGLLEPGVHYVQLKDDFSDLPEKLQWCRENQSACEEISRNSTEFMRQFFNHDQENKLQHDLLTWHSNLYADD